MTVIVFLSLQLSVSLFYNLRRGEKYSQSNGQTKGIEYLKKILRIQTDSRNRNLTFQKIVHAASTSLIFYLPLETNIPRRIDLSDVTKREIIVIIDG